MNFTCCCVNCSHLLFLTVHVSSKVQVSVLLVCQILCAAVCVHTFVELKLDIGTTASVLNNFLFLSFFFFFFSVCAGWLHCIKV